MPTLYLVRHGQASFGAADYDQLSDLGHRQCAALGQWFADRAISFQAVLHGSLRRHTQSLAAIGAGYGVLPPALQWPGLNEYDSAAVIAAIHPEPLATATTPELYRAHFRLLREGLQAWMAGRTSPVGMPSHADFVAGVTSALAHVRARQDGDVLLVSCGGPIATAVAHVLGTSAEVAIELNLRMRNSGLTEFAYTAKRCMLVSFNGLPHLEHPDRRSWLSHA